MYAGSVVEFANKDELFKNPKHPYTIGLFNSIPDIETDSDSLKPIQGIMPDPMNLPEGCPFHPRCDHTRSVCSKKAPERVSVGEPGHFIKCHLYSNTDEGGLGNLVGTVGSERFKKVL
jgi:peptide/nickel transport system ATP-binding protein